MKKLHTKYKNINVGYLILGISNSEITSSVLH